MSNTSQPTLGSLCIGIFLTDGFEQAELTEPRAALEKAGAIIRMLSDKTGQVRGVHHDQPGDLFDVDATFKQAGADEFDALLLPGGEVNASHIRNNPDAQALVRQIDAQGKPIAVICHAPWLLISAGLVQGRKMTSAPDVKRDLEKAGAYWVDEKVVVDRNWVSSRTPDDIPAFNAAFKDILVKHIRGTSDDISSSAA
ncbi:MULTISPECIES: type 1 glutamine amidotransferase domain-containing protein [unclassified Polaromonas]|uniref:type 1 glutamine amidotransferase domain-containing protein n=1 Tax=unclassified Polaromonas TaxID=2638319 RepID=UPI0018CA004B|nr:MULTISPECIES: type 1 glutamine amidotransferase domain-containing protein [unclassified Polaromonas]MBG6073140.1 protease I [Polaromonas sp. CG_9.7]MBG6115144.1 protease I [Polaromonas sp. CG_9.2]MDH6184973.1 protease I [Polaromonas sp. CG_23.6]